MGSQASFGARSQTGLWMVLAAGVSLFGVFANQRSVADEPGGLRFRRDLTFINRDTTRVTERLAIQETRKSLILRRREHELKRNWLIIDS